MCIPEAEGPHCQEHRGTSCHTQLHLRPPGAAGRCSCQGHPCPAVGLPTASPPSLNPSCGAVGPAAALPAPTGQDTGGHSQFLPGITMALQALGLLSSLHFTWVSCTQHRRCQLILNFKKMKMSQIIESEASHQGVTFSGASCGW